MTRTAIITDKTPSRATVLAFVDGDEPTDEELADLDLTPIGGNASWWLLAIADDDIKVGDRVWL